MPYSWSYLSPATGASVVAQSRTRLVPFCRRHHPVTGDLLFDASRRSWEAAQSPLGEALLMALRTQKGTAARDMSYGIDLSKVDNQRENAAVMLRNAILDCLQRFVANGRLKRPVTVTTTVFGEAVLPKISFEDAQGNSGVIAGTPT